MASSRRACTRETSCISSIRQCGKRRRERGRDLRTLLEQGQRPELEVGEVDVPGLLLELPVSLLQLADELRDEHSRRLAARLREGLVERRRREVDGPEGGLHGGAHAVSLDDLPDAGARLPGVTLLLEQGGGDLEELLDARTRLRRQRRAIRDVGQRLARLSELPPLRDAVGGFPGHERRRVDAGRPHPIVEVEHLRGEARGPDEPERAEVRRPALPPGRRPLLERLPPEAVRLHLLEHGEAGIDPRVDRVLAQQPRAERVDRGDRRALELPPLAVEPLALERLRDALLHLRRRLLRERDRQDLTDGRLAGDEEV
jgi:hypothetical protein